MANQHPISYIRAHRAIYRGEYAEIIQRNRVDQERESPQEEEGSYVGEAFDEPPDEEYQALLMESQGVPVGEVEGSVVEARRRGRKARKDLAGFQGEVDWALSTELYRKWQRKLRKNTSEEQGEQLAISSEDEGEEQQGDDEEINDERVQMLGIILTGGMVSMEKMHSAELHALLGPTTSKNCTFCDMGVNEDAEHIFWDCLAWKKVRENFWNEFGP